MRKLTFGKKNDQKKGKQITSSIDLESEREDQLINSKYFVVVN